MLIVNVVIFCEGVNSNTFAVAQSKVSVPVLCVTADFVSLALVDFKVVAVTAPATEPPIVVPSTVPPFISAVVTVPKSEIVAPLKSIVPVPVKFVAVIAPAVDPPIVTPSIVPPFISTVVTVPKSEIVALAADMAAESSVTVPPVSYTHLTLPTICSV